MKVLQVLNHFLPQKTAGTEVYVWALSKNLQAIGVQVKILIPNYGKSYSSEYEYDGLTVYQFAEPSVVDRSLIMGLRESEGLRYYSEILNKEIPDVVHFHEISGSNGISIFHLQAAKETGAKVIMTFHLAGYTCKTDTLFYKNKILCDGIIDLQKCSSCYIHARGYKYWEPLLITASSFTYKYSIDTSRWENKLGTALGVVRLLDKTIHDFQKLIASCDQIVSIAQWYHKVLLANGVNHEKISFIAQGLPLETSSFYENGTPASTSLRLLFIGRITKIKGLHLLIEALEGIDPNEVELSIYGIPDNTSYEYELRSITKSAINIKWKGRLSQNEIIPTMKKYELLCLCSSFSEMSPLVIQEAFAAGLPVIASNVYGNAEQIQHGHNGLLFEFNNVKSLRQNILSCLQDPSLLKRIKNNIKPPQSFSLIASSYYKLYQKTISN